jgi:hypothetical protein
MLKKISAVVATTAMMLVGLTVMPALASSSANPGSNSSKFWNLSHSSPEGVLSSTTVSATLPGDAYNFTNYLEIRFGNTVVQQLAGHEIVVDWNESFPAGVTWASAGWGDEKPYPHLEGRGGGGFYVNYEDVDVSHFNTTPGEPENSSVFRVPASVSEINSDSQYFSIILGLSQERNIVPGVYSISPTLFDRTANAPITIAAVASATNIYPTSSWSSMYGTVSRKGTVPANSEYSESLITCVPRANLTGGNVLEVDALVDGVVTTSGMIKSFAWMGDWNTTGFGLLNSPWTVPNTLEADGRLGIRVESGFRVSNLSGTNPMAIPDFGLIVRDTSANNTQIESSCAANTPAKPTFALTSLTNANVTWARNQDDRNQHPNDYQTAYEYEVFDTNDLNAPVRTGTFQSKQLNNGTYSAGIYFRDEDYNPRPLELDVNYVLKLRAKNGGENIWSPLSVASEPSIIAAPPPPAAPTLELLTTNSIKLTWSKVAADNEADYECNGSPCRTASYEYQIFKQSEPTVVVASGSLMDSTLSGNTYTKTLTDLMSGPPSWRSVNFEGSVNYIAKIRVRDFSSNMQSEYSQASAPSMLVGPPAPAKPTISRVTVNEIQANFIAREGETTGFSYQVRAYLSTDLTNHLATGTCSMSNPQTRQHSCFINTNPMSVGFNAPNLYVVKIFATRNMIASLGSPASDPLIGGLPGVITGTPSGGTVAGDAKYLTEAFPRIIDSFGQRGFIHADTRGNYYSISQPSTQPALGSGINFDIRKIKSDFTGIETSFGPSGKQTLTIPDVLYNNFTNRANYVSHSFFSNSSKIAFFSQVNNCSTNPGEQSMQCGNPSSKSYFTEATLGQAIPNPADVSQKLLDFCRATVDGSMFDQVDNAYFDGFNGLPSFGRPAATLGCSGYKRDGGSGQYTYYQQSFLVTVGADGTPTLVAALNEVNSTENRLERVSASVNPNAVGDDVAAFVLVVTAKGNGSSWSQPYTNYARKILRITANGTVSSTPNAYSVSGSGEPMFNLAPVNDGTTVYALVRQSGMQSSNTLYSANLQTGVFNTGTVITADGQTAENVPNLAFPRNSPPNVDVQDNPDQGQKLAFVRTNFGMQRSFAPMSYRLSDGATVTGEAIQYDISGSPVSYTDIDASGNMFYMFTPSGSGTPNHKVIRWVDTRNMVAVPTPTVTTPAVAISLNAGGATITITGVNLNETSASKKVTKVKFVGGPNGGIDVTPTLKTSTSITVKVPTSAQAGITVAPSALALGNASIMLVLGGGTTVEAGDVIYVGTSKLAHPLILNVSEDAATTTDADRTATIQVGAISQNQGLLMAAPVTPPVLSTTTASVCSIVDGKVRFLSNGTCTVRGFRAGNTWLADGSVTKNIVVRKTDSVVAGFGPGDLPSEVMEADEAIAPVIKLASGRTDYTMTAVDTSVCSITETKMIWFKRGGQDCVITIAHPTATSVWTALTYTWTIPVLPPAGGAGSPLLVRNDNVMVKLPGLALKWDQKKNSVYFVTRVKWVGPVQTRMTFVDDQGDDNVDNDVTHTCLVNFGILKKTALPKNGDPFIVTSPALCTGKTNELGKTMTKAEAAAQKLSYDAFKRVVARNTNAAEPQSTNVQFTYRRELHRSSNYALVGEKLAQRPWTAPTYAKLYYRAIDSITAKLPTGINAPVSATADGAFLPTIALESKRTDYTVTSADSDKCEVLADGRIWAKVVGENCVLTVSTVTSTVWAGRSYTWTIPMVAAVGADAASAVVAPSNGLPALAGPLALTWTQSKSTVGLRLTSRNVGLVTAKMTFTGLDNVAYTCEVKFGSSKKVSSTSVFPFKTQTSPSFCTYTTGMTSAQKAAQAVAYSKFKALVTARKSGLGVGVIPIEISYKFQQHSALTGLLLEGQVLNTVVDKPWSATTHFKLNYRATTN